jgi:hypothetical protein
MKDLTKKLSTLLYYNPSEKRNGDLRKGLREYKFLLTALSRANDHLLNGDLERFDGLVGENACQIRAIKIALIKQKNTIDHTSLAARITYALTQIEQLFTKIESLMHTDTSLAQAIEEFDLDLTPDESFILKSFILGEMKEENDEFSLTKKERITPKKIKDLDNELSSSFTYNISSRIRKLLSRASVDFIQEIASDLEDPNWAKMVSEDFTIDYNSLSCVPMFWTYKTLLNVASKESIPLIVHVKFAEHSDNTHKIIDEDILFFKPCENGTYIETIPTIEDLKKSACIVHGFVCIENENFDKGDWKNKILEHSITDTILAGAADHRQYPDPDMQVEVEDQEFEYYKNFAKSNGFCLENPTTFFINHVYPIEVNRAFAQNF